MEVKNPSDHNTIEEKEARIKERKTNTTNSCTEGLEENNRKSWDLLPFATTLNVVCGRKKLNDYVV